MQQIGRQRFARQRGGSVWVWFYDLPPTTVKALFERLRRQAQEAA
jgi:hypothetical protein